MRKIQIFIFSIFFVFSIVKADSINNQAYKQNYIDYQTNFKRWLLNAAGGLIGGASGSIAELVNQAGTDGKINWTGVATAGELGALGGAISPINAFRGSTAALGGGIVKGVVGYLDIDAIRKIISKYYNNNIMGETS